MAIYVRLDLPTLSQAKKNEASQINPLLSPGEGGPSPQKIKIYVRTRLSYGVVNVKGGASNTAYPDSSKHSIDSDGSNGYTAASLDKTGGVHGTKQIGLQ